MIDWLRADIVDAGKWPLMLCFLAFVATFIGTRTITRLIRAGRGPFRNVVSSSGTHIHHSVPGIILLIVGAFLAVGTAGDGRVVRIAAVMIGAGVSLVLDEFALILHLKDDYWANEGRLSVNLVSLTAAYLGLILVGLSPVGMDDVGDGELVLRLGGIGFFIVHGFSILICVLKGKYRLALISLPIPFLAWPEPFAWPGRARSGRSGATRSRGTRRRRDARGTSTPAGSPCSAAGTASSAACRTSAPSDHISGAGLPVARPRCSAAERSLRSISAIRSFSALSSRRSAVRPLRVT